MYAANGLVDQAAEFAASRSGAEDPGQAADLP